jgi:hypothetical protein
MGPSVIADARAAFERLVKGLTEAAREQQPADRRFHALNMARLAIGFHARIVLNFKWTHYPIRPRGEARIAATHLVTWSPAEAAARCRHHPPRDDPHGQCAGASKTFGENAFAGPRRTCVRGARRRGRSHDRSGAQGDDRRAASVLAARSARIGFAGFGVDGGAHPRLPEAGPDRRVRPKAWVRSTKVFDAMAW